jgi:hypothetical protein
MIEINQAVVEGILASTVPTLNDIGAALMRPEAEHPYVALVMELRNTDGTGSAWRQVVRIPPALMPEVGNLLLDHAALLEE